MIFRDALWAMKDGKRVKLPSWGGYWAWEDGTVMMHCKDGSVLDIRETEDVAFTLDNITSNGWMIATDEDIHISGSGEMSFSAALNALRHGKRVARAGWNGKGQHIELATRISYVQPSGKAVNIDHLDIGNNAICFVGNRGSQIGWLASQADMLANDWRIV